MKYIHNLFETLCNHLSLDDLKQLLMEFLRLDESNGLSYQNSKRWDIATTIFSQRMNNLS